MSDIVQKIKDAADIVELVSDYVPLKRTGASYLGLCPFHNDSKPSMHVSPNKGIFKCFSCGTGGDVFKFWSEYHQKSFKESIKDLAQKYGIPLDFSEESEESSRNFNLSIKMHELAAKYYTDKLLGSEEAQSCREYLEKRNISTAMISDFQLGYSPNEADNKKKLIQYLKAELNCSEEELVNAGLALASKNSASYYDRFRARLMIPIHDERGRVIAFGARALKDPKTGEEPNPKYLNSPETAIYRKGENLYGLHLAKEHIRKEDSVIVVEGYFDQITAYQAGIKNVVANQGTALTSRQAKLLAKFSDSKRILLCFDTDNAGEQATERAIETIMKASQGNNVRLHIMRVPSGKDPDELIRFAGADAFKQLAQSAPLIIDYQINKICQATDISSPQSKVEAVKKLAQYLIYIDNQIELSEYRRQIAERLRVSESILNTELNKNIKAAQSQQNHDPYSHMRPTQNKQEEIKIQEQKSLQKRVNGQLIYNEESLSSIEKEVLLLALRNKDLLENFLSADKKLVTIQAQASLEALSDCSFENPGIDDPEIKYQLLTDKLIAYPEYSAFLADLGLELEKESAKGGMQSRFDEALRRLEWHNLNKQMQEIIQEITELERSIVTHSYQKDSTSVEQGNSDDKWVTLQKQKLEIARLLQNH